MFFELCWPGGEGGGGGGSIYVEGRLRVLGGDRLAGCKELGRAQLYNLQSHKHCTVEAYIITNIMVLGSVYDYKYCTSNRPRQSLRPRISTHPHPLGGHAGGGPGLKKPVDMTSSSVPAGNKFQGYRDM